MSEPLDINDKALCEALLVMGDEKAVAWAWIQAYALNLKQQIDEYVDSDEDGGYVQNRIESAEDLMEIADSHQNGGWGDYVCAGGLFEGEHVDPTFWDKYAIVRGIPRDQVEASGLFTCSC
ncbi:MAG: hypothetical protein [Caudoviricetes sp.]|nr:MAG: hypothetical protein [Caudoviricetes sp.]